MMLCHESLVSFYKMNMTLKKHGFSVEELEDMLPYERDVYVLLIEEELKEKKNKKEHKIDIR